MADVTGQLKDSGYLEGFLRFPWLDVLFDKNPKLISCKVLLEQCLLFDELDKYISNVLIARPN